MNVDIRIVVTAIYLIGNYLAFRFSNDSGYVPDIMPAFILLTSTIGYMFFWIIYLVIN